MPTRLVQRATSISELESGWELQEWSEEREDLQRDDPYCGNHFLNAGRIRVGEWRGNLLGEWSLFPRTCRHCGKYSLGVTAETD